MDRLSSCYFCGAAFDATLDEQPVVPASLHPSADDQKTVVLCRTCQRKLDVILETVIDAVERDASGVTGQSSQGSADAPAEGDDLESTLGDDEDILRPLGGDDDSDPQDPVEAAEASGMEFGDDRARKRDDDESGADESEAEESTNDDGAADDAGGEKKPKYTSSRGAGFRKADEGPSETGSLTGGAFEDKDDDSDGSRRSGRSSGGGKSSGPSSESESTSDAPSGRASGGRSASGGGQGKAGDDASNDADNDTETPSRNVSMTRLENTKVMRLLENREFPVDKDEFVTVAANAYQVSRDDCEKVIDLAIEHDLLREENGQLYGRDS